MISVVLSLLVYPRLSLAPPENGSGWEDEVILEGQMQRTEARGLVKTTALQSSPLAIFISQTECSSVARCPSGIGPVVVLASGQTALVSASNPAANEIRILSMDAPHHTKAPRCPTGPSSPGSARAVTPLHALLRQLLPHAANTHTIIAAMISILCKYL